MPELLDAAATYDAFAPFYDEFTADHDYDDWTATLEGLAVRHGLEGRRLLDAACGTGKSFAPMLDRGYQVTACDISQGMLDRAAGRGGRAARLERHDLRSLPCLGAFDLVWCLDDAVNYLEGDTELAAALAGLERNLAPRGVLVFDANSLATYRTFFASLTVLQSPLRVLSWDGRASHDHAAGAVAEARFEALTATSDHGPWKRLTSTHRQRHHPRQTIEAALVSSGLEPPRVYGMRLDGSITASFDELDNSKAIYLTCRSRSAERR